MALRDHRELNRRAKAFLEAVVLGWDERQRQTYIGGIFQGCRVAARLTYDGQVPVFVNRLLIALDGAAPCIPDEPLIITLLSGLKEDDHIGFDKLETHTKLLAEIEHALGMTTGAQLPASQSQTPVQQTTTASPNPPTATPSQGQATGSTSASGNGQGTTVGATNKPCDGKTGFALILCRLRQMGLLFWGIIGALAVLATIFAVLPQNKQDKFWAWIGFITDTPTPTSTPEIPTETPMVVAITEPTITPSSTATDEPTITPSIMVNLETNVALTLTNTPTPTEMANNQRESLPITIYVSRGQLVIHIADNTSGALLEQLVFIDSSGSRYPLLDYSSFRLYLMNNNPSEGDRCLRIYDPSQENIIPQACQNATLDMFHQVIASVDIFWWQEGSSLQPFIISNGVEHVDTCSVIVCAVMYTNPPEVLTDNLSRSVTFYVSRGQLVIHVEDNVATSSLEQLVFIDSRAIEHFLRNYPSFRTYFINTNRNAGDRCLRIYDPTQENIIPLVCYNASLGMFHQVIASVDIFWWQEGSGLQPFIISNGVDYLADCPVIVCSVTYVEP